MRKLRFDRFAAKVGLELAIKLYYQNFQCLPPGYQDLTFKQLQKTLCETTETGLRALLLEQIRIVAKTVEELWTLLFLTEDFCEKEKIIKRMISLAQTFQEIGTVLSCIGDDNKRLINRILCKQIDAVENYGQLSDIWKRPLSEANKNRLVRRVKKLKMAHEEWRDACRFLHKPSKEFENVVVSNIFATAKGFKQLFEAFKYFGHIDDKEGRKARERLMKLCGRNFNKLSQVCEAVSGMGKGPFLVRMCRMAKGFKHLRVIYESSNMFGKIHQWALAEMVKRAKTFKEYLHLCYYCPENNDYFNRLAGFKVGYAVWLEIHKNTSIQRTVVGNDAAKKLYALACTKLASRVKK